MTTIRLQNIGGAINDATADQVTALRTALGALPKPANDSSATAGQVYVRQADGSALWVTLTTPAPSPSPAPSPGVTDTRPRFGVGSATAGVATPAALLAAMTATGSNGSKAATFIVSPMSGQYGWFACLASASTSGVTFAGPDGTGGWQGASSSGNNGADDGSSPNTSAVTYSDGTTTWRFFRQSFSGAAATFTTS